MSDITVAVLDTQAGLAAINQDGSLAGCTWRDYRDSRITCTSIMVGTPTAAGVRYRCRHGQDERNVMLVERGTPPVIDVDATSDLAHRGWGYDLVRDSLSRDFGLVVDVP